MNYYYNEEGLLQSLLDLHLENYESLKDLSIKANTNLERYFSAIKILDEYDSIYKDVVHSGGYRYVGGYENWDEILDDGEPLWIDTINKKEQQNVHEVGKVIDNLEKKVVSGYLYRNVTSLEYVLLKHCGKYTECDYQNTLEAWYNLLINYCTTFLKGAIIPKTE